MCIKIFIFQTTKGLAIMTESNDQASQVKSLIKKLYNSIDDSKIQELLLKAYKKVDQTNDVADLTAHAAAGVNYLRLTNEITFTPEQESNWRQLRDMGNPEVLHSDPKNHLLDIDNM
jgi:hypothetical protein